MSRRHRRVAAAGDKLVAAAMLCVWAYGYGSSTPPPPSPATAPAHAASYLAVMDELWRALRGAPGLVEHADALTRLNRAKGMASVMITHSLADLDALPTEEDRAKAQGFIERSAIKVLAGLPPRELDRVSEVTPLTGARTRPGRVLGRTRGLAARRRAPRPRQVPDQDRRTARASRSSSPSSAPSGTLYDTDQAIRPAKLVLRAPRGASAASTSRQRTRMPRRVGSTDPVARMGPASQPPGRPALPSAAAAAPVRQSRRAGELPPAARDALSGQARGAIWRRRRLGVC